MLYKMIMKFFYVSLIISLSFSSEIMLKSSSISDDEDSESTEDYSYIFNSKDSDITEIDAAKSEIEELSRQNSSSINAVLLLIDNYEVVDDLLTGDEEVEISDELLDSDDIQSTIEDLQQEVEHQKNIDKTVLAIENYYQKYPSNQVIFKTSEDLEREVDLWEELEDSLNSDTLVEINGASYTITSIDSMIDSLEDEIEYLDDEDLVEMDINDWITYIPEDEYNARIEIINETAIINELIANDVATSEYINLILDQLNILQELMIEGNVSVVKINGYLYDSSQFDDLIHKTQNFSEKLEHDELLDETTENVGKLLNDTDEYNTKNEMEELLDAWDQLLDAMVEGDTVIIGNYTYTYTDVEDEIADLTKRINQLQPGQIEQITSDGSSKIVTASVSDSDSLTEHEYNDIVTSSETFVEGVPIITTTSVVATDSNADPHATSSFLQEILNPSLLRDPNEAPSESHIHNEEYIDGSASYILFTTYIAATLGTGKVYAMPKNSKSSYSIIIEGLDYPTAVCFDKNHNFLYVVEEGNSELQGSISMYQISWNREDSFILANSVSVKVYQGLPSDCKVDGYGNLYFTDSQANLIGMIVYSDLYYASSSAFTELYVATKSKNHIDSPIGIEILNSEDIYFINNGDSTNSDTLITASAIVQSANEVPVNVLTNDGPAKGIALTGQTIYYSLSSGDIRSYHINEKSLDTFNSGFFNGFVGLCYGDDYIYVTVNQAGELYSISLEDSKDATPVLIAYVQAITSCYCVNDYSPLISGILSILILSIS